MRGHGIEILDPTTVYKCLNLTKKCNGGKFERVHLV